MTAVVFAGPSIFGIDCTACAGVALRPPAACGDLLAAVRHGATAIGLIDGIFENSASVWHKEILHALDSGVPTYGASSMGALRAAECHPFGMIGLGQVFDDYRLGRRTADADVAVLHAPAALGYRPLTEALVDVEATVSRICTLGLLSEPEARMLGGAAARIHYKDRTWDVILSEVPTPRRAEIRTIVKAQAFSVKRADAAMLIRHLSETSTHAETRQENQCAQTVQRTLFLEALERRYIDFP